MPTMNLCKIVKKNEPTLGSSRGGGEVDSKVCRLIVYSSFRDTINRDCGLSECDSKKKILVHDLDGSFTDTVDSYILPNANSSWDNQQGTVCSVDDFKIPGAMQITIHGDRIPMDEVRPFTGKLDTLSSRIFLTKLY